MRRRLGGSLGARIIIMIIIINFINCKTAEINFESMFELLAGMAKSTVVESAIYVNNYASSPIIISSCR